MNKFILSALAAFSVSAIALAANNAPFRPRENRKIQALGGLLTVPNSMMGNILFANMQTNVPSGEIEKTVKDLINMTHLDVRLKDVPGKFNPSEASAKAKELGANAVIFLTSSDKCDITLLCAPENGWTVINAEAVTKDAKTPIFAAARLRKEMMRGFFAATGAMSSQYPGSIMGYVGKPSDLDNLVEEIAVDLSMRTVGYMKKMGVSPIQYTTYRKAVEQGWAPAPTNDVQKAIWDKVHATPKNPMKIEFDPKKGR